MRHLHGVLARYVHLPDRGYGSLEDEALRRAGVPAPTVVLVLLGLLLVGCTAVAVRELASRTAST